jgi:hypothetical protein
VHPTSFTLPSLPLWKVTLSPPSFGPWLLRGRGLVPPSSVSCQGLGSKSSSRICCAAVHRGAAYCRIRSEPHVLFQEVLLQLVQQGVRFPHVGFLHESHVAHLLERSPPCGFEFLPEFRLTASTSCSNSRLAASTSRSNSALIAHPQVQFGMRPSMRTINGVFWTVRLQSNGNCRRSAANRRGNRGAGTCHPPG